MRDGLVPRPRNGLSLCSGGAGLDMGIMLAEPDFHTRCYVEWEQYPRDVIIAAQQSGYLAAAPIWDDLTTFDARPLAGAIDTLLAGYPCQPFSAAGQRKGEADERHLWPDVARVARELGDALNWIILENVAGHVSLGAETVLRELRDMGFTPAVGLFSAEEVSAPHERLRWFCVAYRQSGDGWSEQPARDARGRRARPSGSGSELDDAGCERRQQVAGSTHGNEVPNEGWATSNCNKPSGAVEDVDDTASSRRVAAGFRTSTDLKGGKRLSGTGRDNMADACQPRLQGREQRCSLGEWDGQAAFGSAAERSFLPLFPPRPSDTDAWREVLSMAPYLAPSLSVSDVKRTADHLAQMVAAGRMAEAEAESALRRTFDGLAARTRALRLLGNGVLDLVAAHAWRTLSAAHGLRCVDLGTVGGNSETNAAELVVRAAE